MRLRNSTSHRARRLPAFVVTHQFAEDLDRDWLARLRSELPGLGKRIHFALALDLGSQITLIE